MKRNDIYVVTSEITFLAGTDIYKAKLRAAELALERDEYVFFAFNGEKYVVGPDDIAKAVRKP